MHHDFVDHEMLARLSMMPVEARAPAEGTATGHHSSMLRGNSSVFSEYRKYVPGDDLRRLDWKAFARSDRYYIKEYEAERNLRAMIVVDASGSMNFAGRAEKKIQYARRIAASLAWLLVRQGDAAGLCFAREKLVPAALPSRRSAHLARLFDALAAISPSGATALPAALHVLAETTTRRSFVILLSDLFTDPRDLEDALQHLRHRRHDIAVLHLLDPWELDFPLKHPHRFIDLEDGAEIMAVPSALAPAYGKSLRSFLHDIRSRCHHAGAAYHLVSTDTPPELMLTAFLSNRPAGRARA